MTLSKSRTYMSVAASALTSHRSVFFNSGNVGMLQVYLDRG